MQPAPARIQTDLLVIGSGVAGLTFALKAARFASVTVITKRKLDDTATSWAQGGISAVFDPGDSFDAHVQDTLSAGAGLCHEDAVRLCVEEGPRLIEELVELGARFSREGGQEGAPFELGREGGHSQRRVVHAKDMTGAEVQRALVDAVRQHPRVQLIEDQIAVDLITSTKAGLPGPQRCLGAYVLDPARCEVDTVLARAVILATGGAGKAYLYTSNPDTASGDGVAMAFRAGAQVANLEFYQFHPTCLYHPQAKSFLISEALRGEGGILRLEDGRAFMDDYHPMKSLAPRDVVARAIDREMKRSGDDHVVLDMTHLPAEFLRERFPAIYGRCLELGIDITREPIPVVPAAHYMCGGVVTDLEARTDLPGLLAIGETACTGLHGANRLASNSLLEGLVFADQAAKTAEALLAEGPAEAGAERVPDWNPGEAVEPHERVVVSQNWDEIRRLMWNYVGIVRSNKRLIRARRRLALLAEEIKEYYWDYRVTPDVVELRNLATVARLVVECGLRRQESRGLHYTVDHPETHPEAAVDTVLRREDLEGPLP